MIMMIIEQKNVCIFDFFFLYVQQNFVYIFSKVYKQTKIVNKYINIT